MDRDLIKPLEALLLALFTGICFYSVLDGEFLFDDKASVVLNSFVRGQISALEYFLNHPTRFITYATFAIQHAMTGLDVFPYHLGNMLLHFANGIVLLAILKSCQPERDDHILAVACVMVFLAFPPNAQAVSYISQRAALLGTFAVLLTMLITGKVLSKPYLQAKDSLLVAVPVLLGFTTKEIGFVSLAVVLMMWIRREGGFALALRSGKTLWVICAVAGIATAFVLSSAAIRPFLSLVVSEDYFAHMGTQLAVLVDYVLLTVSLHPLSMQHDIPVGWSYKSGIGLAMVVFSTAGAYFLIRRHRLVEGVFATLGIVAFLPESVIPLPDVMVDHRLYLPSAFLVGLFYVWLVRYRERRISVVVVAVALLFASQTIERNQVFWNSKRLWSDVLSKYPDNFRANLTLGRIAYGERDFASAAKYYVKVIPHEPKQGLTNVIAASIEGGMYDQAAAAFRQVDEDFPGDPSFQCMRATLLDRAGEGVGQDIYRECLSGDAGDSVAWQMRAFYNNLLRGEFATAKSRIEWLGGQRDPYLVRQASGLLALAESRPEEAAKLLTEVVVSDPNAEFAKSYLVVAHALLGNRVTEPYLSWLATERPSLHRLRLASELLRDKPKWRATFLEAQLHRCLKQRPDCPDYDCLQAELADELESMGYHAEAEDKFINDVGIFRDKVRCETN